jgi:predicted membrane channel-forming protein YqfA (hemolysin III family)
LSYKPSYFVTRNDKKKMKIFTYIIIGLALLTIAFNATRINLEKPLEGESTVALIGIVTGLCAIVIVVLYKLARKVDEHTK